MTSCTCSPTASLLAIRNFLAIKSVTFLANQQVLVQGSMFDEGFDIDFRTLLNSVNRRFSIANLLYFLY